jgi:uncharacterized membrane protein YgdD (TMEM256/DUF423 family)
MLAVVLGAFGAHALKDRIEPSALEVFRTGATYQFFHGIALICIGIASWNTVQKLFSICAWLFLIGIFVFSGSLYALAISDQKWFGAITPLGGLCFISGWICAAIAFSRVSNRPRIEAS